MASLEENLVRLQEATEDIVDAITEKGGTASYSDGLEAMGDKIRAIPDPQPTLIMKTITQNGVYSSEDDGADGYSEVSVNVQSKEIPKQKSTKPALSGRQFYGSGWTFKSWSGIYSFSGHGIWTDGDNIFYSGGSSSTQYLLNKSTGAWSTKTWNGLNPDGRYIWTDGNNIYYSNGFYASQYVLDKSTDTWSVKTWTGLTSFDAGDIWTNGDNIYYSNGSTQYVLNKSTSTWTSKSWSGLTSFYGSAIWTDGNDIYYSNNNSHYVLNKSTSTWTSKSWSGLTSFYASYIWTDGDNIYYSGDSDQCVLNKLTSTWSSKVWNEINPDGREVWTDGDNIYYTNGTAQYVLDKQSKPTILTTTCKPKFNS